MSITITRISANPCAVRIMDVDGGVITIAHLQYAHQVDALIQMQEDAAALRRSGLLDVIAAAAKEDERDNLDKLNDECATEAQGFHAVTMNTHPVKLPVHQAPACSSRVGSLSELPDGVLRELWMTNDITDIQFANERGRRDAKRQLTQNVIGAARRVAEQWVVDRPRFSLLADLTKAVKALDGCE